MEQPIPDLDGKPDRPFGGLAERSASLGISSESGDVKQHGNFCDGMSQARLFIHRDHRLNEHPTRMRLLFFATWQRASSFGQSDRSPIRPRGDFIFRFDELPTGRSRAEEGPFNWPTRAFGLWITLLHRHTALLFVLGSAYTPDAPSVLTKVPTKLRMCLVSTGLGLLTEC